MKEVKEIKGEREGKDKGNGERWSAWGGVPFPC